MDQQIFGTFLGDIGQLYTSALGWVTETLDIIMSEPALFVMAIAIPISGVAIGFLGRLFRS